MIMGKSTNQPIVFISYSYKDEQQKNELLGCLRAMLSTEQIIQAWHDKPIKGGDEWEHEIAQAINMATVAVLIITPNYLSSHFTRHDEIHRLFERQENEGLNVVPVIAAACNWRSIPWLEQMTVLPRSAVGNWSGPPDSAQFLLIAKEIGKILEKRSEVFELESTSGRWTERYRVPTFFRDNSDAALIDKTDWLRQNFELDDAFFARLLNVEQHQFHSWRIKEEELPDEKLKELREFWEVILHLLSFLNLDARRIRVFLEEEGERPFELPFDPEWKGRSIRAYLEAKGRSGVQNLNKWIQSFRFADRYSNEREQFQWL